MPYRTLIDTESLADHLGDPNWVIFDCRFSLSDPQAGRDVYRSAHIPGAHYAHLDLDLSSRPTGVTGRHPLPSPTTLAEKLGGWGVNRNKQVITYDDSGGPFAARLWWLLRWLGHDAVALLDGGFGKWRREDRSLAGDVPRADSTRFQAAVDAAAAVDTACLMDVVERGGALILDARAPERFRGELEPLDKTAGHVPGARNAPFQANLDRDGIFLPRAELRARFENYLGELAPSGVIHMCGSGVTACHNLLAMEHAGLHGAKLYPGSWSEWITDPVRPIATGE